MAAPAEGRTLAAAAAAGLLYFLSFPPAGWWPLSFVAVGLLFRLLASSPSRRASVLAPALMQAVSAGGILYYLSGLGPTVEAWIVLPFIISGASLGACHHAIARRSGPAAAAAALPFLWVLFEWLHNTANLLPSHIVTWGCALAGTPFLRLAPVTGIYGLSGAAAVLAAAPAVAAAWRAERLRRPWAVAAPVVAAVLLPLLLAAAHRAPPASVPPLPAVATTLRGEDALEEYLDEGAEASPAGQAAARRHIRARAAVIDAMLPPSAGGLVLLPEDAIDFVLSGVEPPARLRLEGISNNGYVLEAYSRLARSRKAYVAAGLTTVRGGRRLNTVALFAPDGSLAGLRDKHALTPGSEYWPMASWLPTWLLYAGDRQFAHPDEQYVPSEEPFRLLRAGGRAIGAMVCLEGQIPSVVRGWRLAGADALVFMTNAHWFHLDPLAYNRQVLNFIRTAAAAYGLPVLLSGKASYFGLVDARGNASVRPGFGADSEDRAEAFTFPPPAPETVAARWGEYFIPMSALALLALAASRRKR